VMSIIIPSNKLSERVILCRRHLCLNVVLLNVVLLNVVLLFYCIVSATAPAFHAKRMKL
jgi:hypothetical protein